MVTMDSKGKRVVRLGAGAGFARDHIEPALDLAQDGELDYLIFECLAERTIALAQQQKQLSPELGYDPMFEARMRAVLPIQRDKGFRIVTNMGAVNPAAAGRLAQRIARELNIPDLKIAVLEGDDVLARLKGSSARFLESGDPLSALSNEIVAANAYLGASGICEALEAGADVVICGRVSDPALFLGPLVHEFGWSITDWTMMGRGTLIGHMLECAGQVSGGYFADPGYKDVENLGNLGFPIGEVDETGALVISKLPGTGGCVTAATCKEQLLYEIHDPRAYYQPDVVADFSEVRIEEIGEDRVRLTGAKGTPRPETLKVSVAYRDGYIGEGQISYGGSGAVARARLAGDIVRQRLARAGVAVDELKVDLIGVDSLHGQRLAGGMGDPYEIRLRIAARFATRTLAEALAREVESLYTNGPAGGGGVVQLVREVIAVQSVLIPREQTTPVVTMLES
ncbi:acyclic terpene utilization AtuA family protein [Rhodopseudomonas sp. NSM]|uniref:acyclic terpene utilization AtuA family protein n=1 Tax=Rhodopseudomonas sp. NSM TaxID=3457630 RepID=UPI0040368259